jgi:hypothetical protein
MEDWILKGTGTCVGIRDDGELARRRLRNGDEIVAVKGWDEISGDNSDSKKFWARFSW